MYRVSLNDCSNKLVSEDFMKANLSKTCYLSLSEAVIFVICRRDICVYVK